MNTTTYKDKWNSIQKERQNKTKEDVKSHWVCPSLFFSVSPDVKDAIIAWWNISDELEELKKWTVPAQVIYNGTWTVKLTNMDNDLSHIYTQTINLNIEKIFKTYWNDFQYYDKLWECLWTMNNWIDIWTGNGVVSNQIALSMKNISSLAKLEKTQTLFQELIAHPEKYNDYSKKIQTIETNQLKFISCDISNDSMDHASKIAHNHFFQLWSLYGLEYYVWDFENLISTKGKENSKLITMFNMLANFEYSELKNILKKIYNSMGDKDVFMTTFFNKRNDLEFESITKLLYDNKETKDWIVRSFADRYNISKDKIIYDIQFKNDWRFFVDIWVLIPKNCALTIADNQWSNISILTKELSWNKNEDFVRFTMLKSYRMDTKEILQLAEEIWFKVDWVIYSEDNLQIMPILYK